MRDYARIAPTFWTRGTGKELRGDPPAQVLASYLMSAPAGGISGIYFLALPMVSHETGLPLDEIRRCLAKLEEKRFAFYDFAHEIVWVVNLVQHQLGKAIESSKDKRLAGLVRELRQIGGHRFVNSFIRRYAIEYPIPADLLDGEAGEVAQLFEKNGSKNGTKSDGSAPRLATPSKVSQPSSPDLRRSRSDHGEEQAYAYEQAQAQATGAVDDVVPLSSVPDISKVRFLRPDVERVYEDTVRRLTAIAGWTIEPKHVRDLERVMQHHLRLGAYATELPKLLEAFYTKACERPEVWAGYGPSGLLRWLQSGRPGPDAGSSAKLRSHEPTGPAYSTTVDDIPALPAVGVLDAETLAAVEQAGKALRFDRTDPKNDFDSQSVLVELENAGGPIPAQQTALAKKGAA